MKIKLCASLAVSIWAACVCAQMTPADKAWAKISHGPVRDKKTGRARLEDLQAWQREGLQFWNVFPDDVRRYQWLWVASSSQFSTAGNKTELRYQSQIEWSHLVRTLCSAAYADNGLDPTMKARIANQELGGEYSLAEAYRRPNLKDIQQQTLRVAAQLPDADIGLCIQPLISFPSSFGLRDPEHLSRFLEPFLKSPSKNLREFAAAKLRYLSYARNPMKLKFTAMDGADVDLEKLRGKVVFIDFWSSSCMACAEQFPAIRKMRDTYKDKGFEVIGICLDNPENRSKVEAIMKERGVNWAMHFSEIPHGVGAPKNPFVRDYAIRAVPVTLLLNRKGLLIEAQVPSEQLEETVKKAVETQ
jgi:peroxiredoxin